jgi:hypothetical protein
VALVQQPDLFRQEGIVGGVADHVVIALLLIMRRDIR